MPLWVDAVEKGFSVPERRRIFQERLPNIDSNISYLGFYYCPSWRVRRSLIDFFNSIGHLRRFERAPVTSAVTLKADIRLLVRCLLGPRLRLTAAPQQFSRFGTDGVIGRRACG
jgi:hypothetical protein